MEKRKERVCCVVRLFSLKELLIKLKMSPPRSQISVAPGNGDGGSTSETPQPPRKKRARVDPTVENVSFSLSLHTLELLVML